MVHTRSLGIAGYNHNHGSVIADGCRCGVLVIAGKGRLFYAAFFAFLFDGIHHLQEIAVDQAGNLIQRLRIGDYGKMPGLSAAGRGRISTRCQDGFNGLLRNGLSRKVQAAFPGQNRINGFVVNHKERSFLLNSSSIIGNPGPLGKTQFQKMAYQNPGFPLALDADAAPQE